MTGEGRAARALRVLALATFLALTLGPAALILASPAWRDGPWRLEDAGILGILLILLLFGALSTWKAFHHCRLQGIVTGAVLLGIAGLLVPALALLHEAFPEPEDREAQLMAPVYPAIGVLAVLRALAVAGGVAALRERRRRSIVPS